MFLISCSFMRKTLLFWPLSWRHVFSSTFSTIVLLFAFHKIGVFRLLVYLCQMKKHVIIAIVFSSVDNSSLYIFACFLFIECFFKKEKSLLNIKLITVSIHMYILSKISYQHKVTLSYLHCTVCVHEKTKSGELLIWMLCFYAVNSDELFRIKTISWSCFFPEEFVEHHSFTFLTLYM